jgi:23S rRNA (uracil1939-C5)-methyltransferase
MATYSEIIEWTKRRHGFTAQTCWIADVKSAYGLTRGSASNRINPRAKVKPCPASKRAAIEDALRHFQMI